MSDEFNLHTCFFAKCHFCLPFMQWNLDKTIVMRCICTLYIKSITIFSCKNKSYNKRELLVCMYIFLRHLMLVVKAFITFIAVRYEQKVFLSYGPNHFFLRLKKDLFLLSLSVKNNNDNKNTPQNPA